MTVAVTDVVLEDGDEVGIVTFVDTFTQPWTVVIHQPLGAGEAFDALLGDSRFDLRGGFMEIGFENLREIGL